MDQEGFQFEISSRNLRSYRQFVSQKELTNINRNYTPERDYTLDEVQDFPNAVIDSYYNDTTNITEVVLQQKNCLELLSS